MIIPKLFGLDLPRIISESVGTNLLPSILRKRIYAERVAGSLNAGFVTTYIDYECQGLTTGSTYQVKPGLEQTSKIKGFLLAYDLNKLGVIPMIGDLFSVGFINMDRTQGRQFFDIVSVDGDPSVSLYTLYMR